MMMNFKKNQNNAVCSMDCKNCPNGASQPNPMDDSMFEKSIAMLHNWVMLEAIREDHPKERIVMVILPGAGGELLTEAGSRDIFEDVYDEMEADLVADGELLLHYDKSDVIETDRTRYRVGSCGGFGNRPERQRMQHQSVYAGTHHRLCEREPDGGFNWRRVGSSTAPDLRRCL